MSGGPDPENLEALGIVEVDRGVCEDTFENRQILREAKLRWRVVLGDEPTGLIEAVRPLDLDEKQRASYERFKDILVDRADPWADYIPANEYPLDMPGVPYWVHRRVEKHEDDVARGLAEHRRALLPTRCVTVRRDGTRCWFWSFDKESNGRCRNHAGTSHREFNMGYQIAARTKIVQSLPAMADELEALVYDREAPHNVRLKAITEMMDRGGIRAGMEIDISGGVTVEQQDPAAVIREKLDKLGARIAKAEQAALELEAGPDPDTDILDAEVVSDTEETA